MKHFRIYETLDSTNKEANRLLASGQNLHGTAILTPHQTDGRGQYGRSWYANPGCHLAMSLILQPEKMLPDDLPLLALKSSLAVVRTLHIVDHTLHTLIKWPNDIYIAENKISGILIENSISSIKVQHSVIGIGMNVNEPHFPADLPNPVSLFILTRKEFQINAIAEILREQLMKIMEESPGTWKPEYDQVIYGLAKQHAFEMDGNKISARLIGVDLDGKIRVTTDDKESKSYFSHEISWLK